MDNFDKDIFNFTISFMEKLENKFYDQNVQKELTILNKAIFITKYMNHSSSIKLLDRLNNSDLFFFTKEHFTLLIDYLYFGKEIEPKVENYLNNNDDIEGVFNLFRQELSHEKHDNYSDLHLFESNKEFFLTNSWVIWQNYHGKFKEKYPNVVFSEEKLNTREILEKSYEIFENFNKKSSHEINRGFMIEIINIMFMRFSHEHPIYMKTLFDALTNQESKHSLSMTTMFSLFDFLNGSLWFVKNNDALEAEKLIPAALNKINPWDFLTYISFERENDNKMNSSQWINAINRKNKMKLVPWDVMRKLP